MAAAYLSAQGLTQIEIGPRLGVSQPEVSRLLGRAEEKKWLKKLPTFTCPEAQKELWEKARVKFFSSDDLLLAKLKTLESNRGLFLRKVSVVQSDPDEGFDTSVAQPFEELVARATIMGVTWGRTISRLVAALRNHLTFPLRHQDPVQIVPLSRILLVGAGCTALRTH
jgi:DNA-binding transcriptional regulator LsrR (DeoR family)